MVFLLQTVPIQYRKYEFILEHGPPLMYFLLAATESRFKGLSAATTKEGDVTFQDYPNPLGGFWEFVMSDLYASYVRNFVMITGDHSLIDQFFSNIAQLIPNGIVMI